MIVIATKYTLSKPTFSQTQIHYFEQCITNKEIIMKKLAVIILAIASLTSCKKQNFKYHVVGSGIKHIESFDEGLSVGDTTTYEVNMVTYTVVLDSLIQ